MFTIFITLVSFAVGILALIADAIDNRFFGRKYASEIEVVGITAGLMMGIFGGWTLLCIF